MFGNARAGIVASEADEGPAVVAAGRDDVDFIAAVRSVLVVPDRAGVGMDDEGEGVAMPEREDLDR
jgi:hypothetical protein